MEEGGEVSDKPQEEANGVVGASGARADSARALKRPDPNCAHDWNVGYCMKCRGHHECYRFIDDVCQICGTMA